MDKAIEKNYIFKRPFMFSRKDRNEAPSLIPAEILSPIKNLLTETFSSNLEKSNYKLDLYGEIYADEIIIIFSLIDMNKSDGNTISLFISDEYDQKSNLEEKINSIVNASSEFFEIIFSSSEEKLLEIYRPNWERTDLPKNNFYYKISRENIKLTIEANKLLGQH